MFYTTTDNAIARHLFDDGTEVAWTYDHDADNPILDHDHLFCAITRVPYGYESFEAVDTLGLFDSIDDRNEALDSALVMVEYETAILKENYGPEWWVTPEDDDAYEDWSYHMDELLGAFEEWDSLLEPLEGVSEYTLPAMEEWGHPEFRVAIDHEEFQRRTGLRVTPENLERVAKGIVDTYAAWAEGSVLMVGITLPDGTEDDCGGMYGYDPHDEETAAQVCEGFTGHNPLNND